MYLDQNKWVELLRAEKNPTANALAKEVLDRLKVLASDRRIVVPLSASHYLETWNRKNWQSRHGLAEIMRALSNFATVAPIQQIVRWEIEKFLLQNFRSPNCRCNIPDINGLLLGHGVEHAFNSTTGRLRLVESIAGPGVREGAPAIPHDEFLRLLEEARALPDDAYEWWSLAGDESPLDVEGFETRSEHRLGDERVELEEKLAREISTDPHLRRRLDDYLIAQELSLISEDVDEIAFWHNANTNLLMAEWMRQGPSFGKYYLESLPTSLCIFSLRKAKHANPQWKWQQHDRSDMTALSVAVPYCDVVVTERQWAHVFKSTRLDSRFGTTVLSRIQDLEQVLPHT